MAVDHGRAAAAVRELLIAIGEDPERDGLLETPDRVARAWGELLDGHGVDSTRPESRLEMSRGQTYRWLAANARRFGFVPYVYEPWHWEYVGG